MFLYIYFCLVFVYRLIAVYILNHDHTKLKFLYKQFNIYKPHKLNQ